MLYFYMPLVTAIFLWYYVINIFGLLLFWSDPIKQADMYVYGFFQFQVPPLEVAFLFSGLCAFC